MQIFVGFVGLLIAACVAAIGYIQMRIAHQKLVFDLFSRRVTVYDAVNDAVKMLRSPPDGVSEDQSRHNAKVMLHDAWTSSRFLFGQEVTDWITRLQEAVQGERMNYLRMQQATSLADRSTFAALTEKDANFVDQWKEPWTTICTPYLRMDVQVMSTPLEWLYARNKARLSYQDQ